MLLVSSKQIEGQEVIAAIIIVSREILVSGLREYLAKFRLKMPVSNMAKIKTFFQMFAISVLLTGSSGDKLLFDYGSEIGIALLWFSAFLTLITGYSYIKKGINHAID